jgi:hypothetical protein
VLALVESDDVLQEEILDNELLYNLLLLSEVSPYSSALSYCTVFIYVPYTLGKHQVSSSS